jgi:hypothetical protein
MGTLGQEGKRVGAIRLFEYLKRGQQSSPCSSLPSSTAILWLGVTAHPTAEWVARRARECLPPYSLFPQLVGERAVDVFRTPKIGDLERQSAQVTLAQDDSVVQALAANGPNRFVRQNRSAMAIAARSEKPDHPVSLRDSLPSSTGRGFGTHAFFVSASGFQPRAREFPRSARADR